MQNKKIEHKPTARQSAANMLEKRATGTNYMAACAPYVNYHLLLS